MQVMIGEPGKTVAQQATRHHIQRVGQDRQRRHHDHHAHGTAQDGKWETYAGDYLATSTTTRFTFRSVRDSNGQGLDFTAEGNCVDDLSFDKAYKLSYDKNSSDATGSVPSNQYGKENTVQPAKSKTTGSVGLAADKTASGLTVHDLEEERQGQGALQFEGGFHAAGRVQGSGRQGGDHRLQGRGRRAGRERRVRHPEVDDRQGGVPMFLSTPWGVDVSRFRLAVVGALRPAGGVRRPFPCGPVQATRAGSW
ncbi:MAG: hypothetical protein ACLT3W_06410 [Bifidobacterium pseudocatenulatum]